MIKDFFPKEFLSDRPAIVLTVVGALLALVNILSLFISVRPSEFEVPVRYSQYGGSPVILGEWFNLFELALFTLITVLINTALAVRLHKVKRGITLAMLIANIVVLIFAFLVTRALIGISPAL